MVTLPAQMLAGRQSVYRGTFAEFRVPANFVQVSPRSCRELFPCLRAWDGTARRVSGMCCTYTLNT